MTTIRLRRGTAAQWTSANPLLDSGEVGVETDTGKHKIGEGVKRWNDLPYFLPENLLDAKYALKGSGGGTIASADDIADGTTKVIMTKTERSKLEGVDAGATQNSSDDYLRHLENALGELDPSHVTGLLSTLMDMALKSGSIKQFSDVSTVNPSDGSALVFDATPGAYVPSDLAQRFAEIGADGRISESDLPLWFMPTVAINEGDPVPEMFPAPGLVIEIGAALDLTPVIINSGVTENLTSIDLTLTKDFKAGDYLGLGVAASNESTPNVLAGFTAALSAGASTTTWSAFNGPNASAAVAQGLLKFSADTPSGTKVTITARDASNVAIARPHIMAAAFTMPNLAAVAPVDQTAIAGGGSSSNMSAIAAGPVTADTAPIPEMGIGVAAWNSGTGTTVRTLAGKNGWTELAEVESETASARSLFVGFLPVEASTRPTFETIMTASDAATGQWAANFVTYKSKVA